MFEKVMPKCFLFSLLFFSCVYTKNESKSSSNNFDGHFMVVSDSEKNKVLVLFCDNNKKIFFNYKEVRGIKNITEVSYGGLESASFYRGQLKQILNIETLKTLRLTLVDLSNNDMAILSSIKSRIKLLQLTATNISDAALINLAKLETLERLDLVNCKLISSQAIRTFVLIAEAIETLSISSSSVKMEDRFFLYKLKKNIEILEYSDDSKIIGMKVSSRHIDKEFFTKNTIYQHLEFLSLLNCNAISKQDIISFVNKANQLKVLIVSANTFSKEDRDFLYETKPSLEIYEE